MTDYRLHFAILPRQLYGPDEWRRMRRLDCKPRWVWLQYCWKMKARPRDYYAAFQSDEPTAPVRCTFPECWCSLLDNGRHDCPKLRNAK